MKQLIAAALMAIYTLCFIPVDSQGQTVSDTDIEFKAKLLTTSRFGGASERTVLEDIKKQPFTFLKNDSSDIVVMKISFTQSNFKGDERRVIWIGTCNYYVAYNRNKFKYYQLGGFSCLDIGDFFQDLTPHEFTDITSDHQLSKDIDFLCLYQYSQMSDKKRKKSKNIPCLKTCTEELSEYLKSK